MESYGQYCPLAKGAEVFAERWTPLILRELLRGSTTFNDLHRGVPSMSRSLLSSRLKKLEACGVLVRRVRSTGTHYELTPAGLELGSVVTQLGTWAQRWYRSTFTGAELDVGVLMWDIRCTVDAKALPPIRTVVQFIFSDLRVNSRAWWLVNEDGEVDLCPVDPGDDPKFANLHDVANHDARLDGGSFNRHCIAERGAHHCRAARPTAVVWRLVAPQPLRSGCGRSSCATLIAARRPFCGRHCEDPSFRTLSVGVGSM
jgi:DNA-binding HxlR family transcriptional regulator